MKSKEKIHKKIPGVMLIGLAALISGCATGGGPDRTAVLEQHIYAAEKKIERLEQEFQVGSRPDSGNVGDSLQARFADVRVKSEELNNRLQSLNGRMEEVEFQVQQKIQLLDDKRLKSEELIAMQETRISRLEEYLNVEKSAPNGPAGNTGMVPNPTPNPLPNTQGGVLSEDKLYETAKLAFDREDFDTARVQFEKLIQKYPKSENADNAQFWIAEIYYRQKWYEKAALEYQKVIEKYPNGNKVRSALLKQGYSFLNMGDKGNARIILKQLTDKYPKSPEAEAARAKLQSL